MKLSEKIRQKCAPESLKGIEIRMLRFTGRALLALCFLAYLASTAPAAWDWVQIKRVRVQSLAGMEDIVRESVLYGDAARAETWISYRPMSESAEIERRAVPLSGDFSPFFFIDLARRAAIRDDTDQKRFWMMVARFRLRYDALRCGAPDSIETSNDLLGIMQAFGPDIVEDLPQGEAIPYARRALNFDAQYPANDDPKTICKVIDKMTGDGPRYVEQPKANWSPIRFQLRLLTDRGLEKAEAEQKTQKK